MAVDVESERTTAPAWVVTPEEAEALEARGQFYAAGFMAGEDTPVPLRFTNAITNLLAKCPLHPYDGELLYPAKGMIWFPPGIKQALYQFYVQLGRDREYADKLAAEASGPLEKSAFEKLQLCAHTYKETGGYTHSIINFDRLLAEGVDSYADRVRAKVAANGSRERRDLYASLLAVVDAIELYRMRIIDYLSRLSFEDPAKEKNRLRLIEAYSSRLPMRPAVGFYEAMVSTIFMYAFDGSDDLGRFDQFMWPYYRDDLAAGRITREEAVALVATLWTYVDDCGGWNVALAGTTPQGEQAGNDLTVVCLEAGKGRRRPNLALRLRKDTPDEIWDAAIDLISTGNGIPALYCEENYLAAIDEAHLDIADSDKFNYAFGGCTELMVHGCSNVGSLEGNYNALKALETTIYDQLSACDSFDELVDRYESVMRTEIANMTARMSRNQEERAKTDPLPIRTLLIDDCIDRGKSYSAGGARCNWAVVCIVGLSNAVDSLIAMKKALYEEKKTLVEELIAALKANFEGYEDLLAYLRKCPRFGNDDPEVDALANRLSGFVFREFKRYAPWRGGKYLCSTIMFVTYSWFGRPVGATPEGRLAGTPVADSAGPVQGRDRKGPTAMLRSAAALQQIHAPGTLVVNIRVSKKLFKTRTDREKLKSLIRSYFDLGGLQLQVTVVDQAVLRDAIAHPEDHRDLIVRIGGYSEYFNNLEKDIQLSVLERTEHM